MAVDPAYGLLFGNAPSATGPAPQPGAQGTALNALTSGLNAAGGAGSGGAFLSADSGPRIPFQRPDSFRSGGNKPLPGGGRLPRRQKNGITLTVDEAKSEFYSWDDGKQRDYARKLWVMGYPAVNSPDDVAGAAQTWESAVEQSAKFVTAGNPKSPDQVLQLFAGANADALAKRNEKMASQAGTTVQKARSVNLTDPSHAKAIIQSAFQQSMGRNATSAEIRTLTRTLNAQEQANPSTQTQATTRDSLGNVTSTSSTQAGGMDANQYVSDQAQADPESGAYQAATTYMSGLMGILKSGL